MHAVGLFVSKLKGDRNAGQDRECNPRIHNLSIEMQCRYDHIDFLKAASHWTEGIDNIAREIGKFYVDELIYSREHT